MNANLLQNTVLALLKAAPGLGSIHVNKGLLLIDAYHHSLFLKTLTGIDYVKHDLGPVPEPAAHGILYEMELDKNKVEVRMEKRGPRHARKAHYAISEPDYSLFSQTQKEIISEVAVMIKRMSASRLSRLTHNEVWEGTPKGGKIPIEAAYSAHIASRNIRALTEAETEQAKFVLEGLYGQARTVLPAGS